MKRILSFSFSLIFLLFIFLSASPVVDASENISSWTELMTTSTVNDSGSNVFTNSAKNFSFDIPLDAAMTCRKVEMLFVCTDGTGPSKVEFVSDSSATALTLYKLDGSTYRVVGFIPEAVYSSLRFRFTRSTTALSNYEVLSCKVSSVKTQEFVAEGTALINGVEYNWPEEVKVPGIEQESDAYAQIRFTVTDWQKYDRLTIWGSAANFEWTSVRATVGTSAVPMEITFIDADPSGERTYYFFSNTITGAEDGGGTWVGDINFHQSDSVTHYRYHTKSLYCVTLDLTAMDKTANFGGAPYTLVCYMTGNYNTVSGYTFTAQYVNGGIIVPDNSSASWWYKFTTFMTDLFGGSDPDAEDFGSTMESESAELQDAVGTLDQVTKPDVEALDVSLDAYMSPESMTSINAFLSPVFSNDVIVSMILICLTCAFASYALFGKR